MQRPIPTNIILDEVLVASGDHQFSSQDSKAVKHRSVGTRSDEEVEPASRARSVSAAPANKSSTESIQVESQEVSASPLLRAPGL